MSGTQRSRISRLESVRSFQDKLEQTLRMVRESKKVPEEHRRESQKVLALVSLDIDRFKSINDTLGHAAGDEVLRRFAKLLRESVRGSDSVARGEGRSSWSLCRAQIQRVPLGTLTNFAKKSNHLFLMPIRILRSPRALVSCPQPRRKTRRLLGAMPTKRFMMQKMAGIELSCTKEKTKKM